MNDEVEVLSTERRRELFVALVAAQDEGLGVRESRDTIARRFGVAPEVVRGVEDEGLDHRWPPFGKG